MSQRVWSKRCSKTRRLTGRNSRADTTVIWHVFYSDFLSAESIERSATLCFVMNTLLSRCLEIFINTCLAHEVEFHYCDMNAYPELTFMQKFLKIKIQITLQCSINKICMTCKSCAVVLHATGMVCLWMSSTKHATSTK